MNKYLVIPNIEAQGVAVLNGPFSIGYPPITAYSGLAHSIMRRYRDLSGDHAGVASFLVVHHDGRLRVHGKYRNKITQKRFVYTRETPPKSNQMYHTPAAEMTPQGDVRFSLIIAADFDDASFDAMVRNGRLDALVGTHALGGSIARTKRPFLTSDVFKAILSTPGGSIVCDSTPELFLPGAAGDSLDALISILAKNDAMDFQSSRRLAALQIGFRAISPLTDRRGARNPTAMHCFVEPVIGLIEWKRKHVALDEAENDIAHLFWVPNIDRAKGLFFCSQATTENHA